MRFCQPHWDALRAAIEVRGLTVLVSENGEEAAAKLAGALQEGPSIDNFDPLMNAQWLIATNAMQHISRAGGNPLYLMMSDGAPEDPVEGHAGRTWSRCPICYLNLAHEITCDGDGCKLDRKTGFDWMIERAADSQVEAWKAMRP